MNIIETKTVAANKSIWVRPTLRRIEAGSAESGSLANADGGGGNQAS